MGGGGERVGEKGHKLRCRGETGRGQAVNYTCHSMRTTRRSSSGHLGGVGGSGTEMDVAA